MRKALFRIFLALCTLFVVAVIVIWGWLQATSATAADLPALKTGDLVFQTSRSNQSLAIMLASKSPYSHMGIVEVQADGKAVVLEAVATVRETALESWVTRGLGGRVLVKRLPSLTETQAANIVAAARSHFGKSYDMFFHDDRETIYCSELAVLAYADAAGLGLGTSQRLAELDIDNFAARRLIERRWRQHPACAKEVASGFEACLAKLREQRLVTPASVAADGRLVTLFSNYGPLKSQ